MYKYNNSRFRKKQKTFMGRKIKKIQGFIIANLFFCC